MHYKCHKHEDVNEDEEIWVRKANMHHLEPQASTGTEAQSADPGLPIRLAPDGHVAPHGPVTQ